MENGMKNQTTSAGRFMGRSTIYEKGNDGAPYMTRYWFGRLRLHIFYRGDLDPDHHDHPWAFWTFPLTSYVEEVVHPDIAFAGRDQTVVCKSGPTTARQIVKAFRLHYRPATHTHRVLGRVLPGVSIRTYRAPDGGREEWGPESTDGKIVTIVWRGPDERRWGFLKNRDGRWCWVHWKEYVFGNGKSAPCE